MSRASTYRFLAPHRQAKYQAWLAAGNKELSVVDLIGDQDADYFLDYIQRKIRVVMQERFDRFMSGEDA